MGIPAHTKRLTMAQALVRHLANQFTVIDGVKQRLCGGGFAIFGHGNVICLGEALQEYRQELPLWRGQNEQSMALAGVAYAKQKLRRRFMFATASAGPGTTNMVTAAAVAHTNRLPILLLCGDTYVSRLPDPVLQQVENFGTPSVSVNDAFMSVTRYWDRITHPAQIIQSLPAAIATMLDPADCGPTFLGLPQDVQGWSYDYPEEFFVERVHEIRRQPPDANQVKAAAVALRAARRPVIIAGGGVQYSGATDALKAFAERFNIPIVETIAGRANLPHDYQLNMGPIGVTGSTSANTIAGQADLILAVGTRLQDFTTGSWTAFDRDARIVTINVARQDACKHMALPVVGDALLTLDNLSEALGAHRLDNSWAERASAERQAWDRYVDENTSPTTASGTNRPMSYAQVIGTINRLCHPRDRIVAAAGGLPAEITANWRTLSTSSVDIEFGYSCMGYEIAGGWGARIAQKETEPDLETIVFTGDGSYLMMNADVYSSVLSGHKLIIIICDNGGFAVINKLQSNTGNVPFNNLIADCNIATAPFSIDFASHARAMGAAAEDVHSIEELEGAFARAKLARSTYVICLKVDAFEGWTTEGHAWWEIGTPSVSNRPQVLQARVEIEHGRGRQRVGI